MCAPKEHRDKCSVELADIFNLHGDDYCHNHVLTPQQHKVINAIKNCRTSVLGGHVSQCDNCNATYISYNSCGNRHCPKCQALRTAFWLEQRQQELLPVSYFHIVFTLPHELNTLILYNKKELYSLLFKSAWETIKTLGQDQQRLNGLMGMISLLHTWGQILTIHNHVHCIVPGGALTDDNEWNASGEKYLFPVAVMSEIFRGIYISALRKLYENGKLKIPDNDQQLDDKNNFDKLLNVLMEKSWVVYAKRPFAGPKSLLNYLGKYVNKIAISNYRIVDCDENSVTFKWRDYSDGNKIKQMKLKPDEFIRRFLSHVVPKGFMRIRFFGFLANSCKKEKIDTIKKILACETKELEQKKDVNDLMLELTGIDISICPTCKKGHLNIIKTIPHKFGKTKFDTS